MDRDYYWMVVQPDGSIAEYGDREPTLKALQDAVGGNIEAVPAPISGVAVMINEEHIDKNGDPLPMNPKATAWLIDVLWPGQRIVGPMVVAGAPTDDGELSPLTDEQVMALREALS